MKNNFLSKIITKAVLVSSIFLASFSAIACINDVDTRFFESQNFPDVYQLMSGDFAKNAPELYAWRIQDRLKKIEENPNNPSYYDDLSVAYEKTGQTQKAIDLMEKVYSQYPNRYETIANLGTFYIHNKQYAKGLELLKKAIIINPDAHFGREIYQIKVVEYFLKENPDGKITLPIQKGKHNFADFILADTFKSNDTNEPNDKIDEILKATVGIGGMLKFGNSDSPILLEAMGDLYAYLDHHYEYYRAKESTQFGKIAMLFYTAAIEKNNSSTVNMEQYLEVKKLSTSTYPGAASYSLHRYKESAKETINNFRQKQLDIISKGGDIEKNIHTQLYPGSQKQEDLFVLAKENYYHLLNGSKEDYYTLLEINRRSLKNKMETSTHILLGVLALYALIVIPLLASFLYHKYNKHDISEHPFKFKKAFFIIMVILFVYLLINTLMFNYGLNHLSYT